MSAPVIDAMYCDGLGAAPVAPTDPAQKCPGCGLFGCAHYLDCPTQYTVEAEIDARMTTLNAATRCEYSASHAGRPAVTLIHAPALADIWPHGVPSCADCKAFYEAMA